MLTVGSLCTGIGGIDLGLEATGEFQVKWQSEIDPYACRVLRKHWPNVPNIGDLTKVDWETIPRVDVITAGFPCQPASSAGKRRGQNDERWIWPAIAKAIRTLRPRIVLLENVPGLLTVGRGLAMAEVLGHLAEAGYDLEWDIVSAASVGAPHLRERVFLVAYASGERTQSTQLGRLRHGVESGSKDVADSNGSGFVRPKQLENDCPEQRGSSAVDARASSQVRKSAMADAESPRLPARIGPRTTRQSRPQHRGEANSGNPWSTECRLGRTPHGLPPHMDCGGWECGIPRVTKNPRDRAARLRALGNSVVPAVIETRARRILQIIQQGGVNHG